MTKEPGTAPLVGITSNRFGRQSAAGYPWMTLVGAEERMIDSVLEAGAVPVLLPLSRSSTVRPEDLTSGLDGLLLSGGADVDPRSYGETPVLDSLGCQPERDSLEIDLALRAHAGDLPILAICRGFHILNVALGGTLWQDLEVQAEARRSTSGRGGPCSPVRHLDLADYEGNRHELLPEGGAGLMDELFGPEIGVVNSTHHQGVKAPAPCLSIAARAPDGLIEAVRAHDRRFVVGVQWHPEWLEGAPHRQLFRLFVEAARFRRADRSGGRPETDRSGAPRTRSSGALRIVRNHDPERRWEEGEDR